MKAIRPLSNEHSDIVHDALPEIAEVSPPPRSWIVFFDDAWTHLRESLGAQSYYAVGLALQKGLPYLLIPLLIRLYGDQTYASYVLFYSSSLMFANFVGLAIPNSAITFWYAEEDKVSLSWTYVILLLVCQGALTLVLGIGAFYVFGKSFGREQAALLTVASLVFAVLYNFNTLLTGVCRARNYSKGYFFAQSIAGILLVLCVILLAGRPSLQVLIGAFTFSLVCQNLYLLHSLRGYLHWSAIHFDRSLAKRVLSYSLPLIPHIGATLFYFWIDKYLVRLYFSVAEFSQFAITLQYAYAQSFFAQVFAMHTFPLICQLTAEGDEHRIRLVLRTYNSLLVVLGVAWIAAILFVQHLGFQLRVDPIGLVLLGSAILLWNVASNYINVLWARFKTTSVSAIILLTGGILVAILSAGCLLHNLVLCYWSHVIWAAAVLLALVCFEHSQRGPASVVQVAEAASSRQRIN